jgi:DNA-binding MarR family transcriptional regulator
MVEDVVRALGLLTLGSRLKRLGERLQADTQQVIDEGGLPVQASQFPVLAAIDRLGPLTVGELAQALGVTQPGATRTVAQLAAAGLIRVEQPPEDQRRRLAALTPEGRRLLERGKSEVWPRVERAVGELCSGLTGPLLDQLGRIEEGLAAAPLIRRGGPKP